MIEAKYSMTHEFSEHQVFAESIQISQNIKGILSSSKEIQIRLYKVILTKSILMLRNIFLMI